MLIYNSENECYSRFIPIDQAAEMQEKIKKLQESRQIPPHRQSFYIPCGWLSFQSTPSFYVLVLYKDIY